MQKAGVIALENQLTEILSPVRKWMGGGLASKLSLLIGPLDYREKTPSALPPARLVYGVAPHGHS
jgi:hypothetical protein